MGDEPHILLVRPFQSRDSWGIPKGHIESGESIEQCAIREVIEETGITPVLICELGSAKVNHKKEHKTVVMWLAYPRDPNMEPIIDERENVDVKYFKVTELPKIHVYQFPLLEQLVKNLHTYPRETFSSDSAA